MSVAPSSLRNTAELTLPGVVVGLGAGLIAGGMAAAAGLPLGYVILTFFALGVPLALLGAVYDMLLASGRVRLGGVAPAALYWLPGFPLARLIHEVVMDLGSGRVIALPEGFLPFLAFQGIMSLGYAIGFLWCHEMVATVWWPRVRDHNPVAARYVVQYTQQAAAMQDRKSKNRAG